MNMWITCAGEVQVATIFELSLNDIAKTQRGWHLILLRPHGLNILICNQSLNINVYTMMLVMKTFMFSNVQSLFVINPTLF